MKMSRKFFGTIKIYSLELVENPNKVNVPLMTRSHFIKSGEEDSKKNAKLQNSKNSPTHLANSSCK